MPPLSKSRWFSVDEFRCKSGEAYPSDWVDDARWYRLATTLDLIRDEWGSPLYVVCGYRSPAYNKALREADIAKKGWSGVAQNSQHMQGRAADIKPSAGAKDLHAMVLRMSLAGKLPLLRGLGFYGDAFVHVDIRGTDHLVQWDGTKPGKF